MRANAQKVASPTDPTNWEADEIYYPSPHHKNCIRLEVEVLPQLRGKIVIDKAGDFYYYNREKRRWYKVEHGIFSLYRSLCYMLDTHQGELPLLEDIQNVCRAGHIELVDLTTQNFADSWAIELQQRLSDRASLLRRVVDEHKKSAHDEIALVATFLDSKGRVNSGVLMCRTIKALEELERRVANIGSMAPWLQYYRTALIEYIEHLERVLGGCATKLDELSKEKNLKRAAAILSQYAKFVKQLSLKPYIHQQKYLVDDLEVMVRLLREEDIQEINTMARISLNGVRIMMMRKPIELMMLHVTRAADEGQMNPALLIRVRRWVNRAVNTLVPSISDQGFKQPVMDDLFARLREVQKLLMLQSHPDFPAVKVALDQTLVLI